jgi:hypothetical protein
MSDKRPLCLEIADFLYDKGIYTFAVKFYKKIVDNSIRKGIIEFDKEKIIDAREWLYDNFRRGLENRNYERACCCARDLIFYPNSKEVLGLDIKKSGLLEMLKKSD